MQASIVKRVQVLLLALVGVPVMLLIVGCPPPEEPPALAVDVTADQTSGNPPLAILATANPTGGTPPYSFQWLSAPGGLLGAPTAQSTNVSFIIAGTYTVSCTVTDSAGQTASDSVQINVGVAPPAITRTLFVTNLTGNSVTAYTVANPSDINGNIAPAANLSGAQTLISSPRGIALDAQRILQVGNDGNNSITSYADASVLAGINGNVAPTRNVQGAATAIGALRGIARQSTPATDLMYVSNGTLIRVFAGASTATFNGNLAPVRTITNAVLTQTRGIALDNNDNLYIANETPGRVFVYANASTLNGDVAPTRIIQNAVINTARDVFIDTSGRLFVVDHTDDQIHVYNNGATVNGNVAPDVTLTIPGADTLNSVVTDSNGVGYISDRLGNRVFSYDNLATRNGTITPDRVLQGAATLLNQPYNLLILE